MYVLSHIRFINANIERLHFERFCPKELGLGRFPYKYFSRPPVSKHFGVWPHLNCLPFVRAPQISNIMAIIPIRFMIWRQASLLIKICAVVSIICILMSGWMLLPFSKFKHGIKYLLMFIAILQVISTIIIFLLPDAGIPPLIRFSV